jgi:hypothetical protein
MTQKPHLIPYRWKPGQSGNPKGQKPKVMSAILKQLKEAGFEPVTRDQITDAFGVVMSMSSDEVMAMVNDKDQPMLLRIVGKRLLSKDGHEMLEKMLDRAHGKAKQQLDHLSGGEKIAPVITLTHLSLDDLRRLTQDSGNSADDQSGGQG